MTFFKNNEFLKSFSILLSGSLIAQIISFLASPIMTRLFSLDVIGEYTLVLTAVGMFGSIICLRYDVVIVSEEDEDKIISLMGLSFFLTIVLSLLVSLIFVIYYFFNDYSISQCVFYMISIFILLVLTGLSNIMFSYNNRYGDYKLMTQVTVVRAIFKELPVVLGGLIYPKTTMLILSNIIGIIFGFKKQSSRFFNSIRGTSIKNLFHKVEMKKVAHQYRNQALFSTPSLFVNNLSYSIINLFIQNLFGSAVLGLYSVSYRVLGIPLSVVGSNISHVYLEHASKAYNSTGRYSNVFTRTSIILLLLAIPMVFLFYVFAPPVCQWMFGPSYYEAGLYIRYLAPLYGFRFITSPLSVGVIISQKQNRELLLQVSFIFISLIVFLIVLLLHLTIKDYLLMISILYSIIYIVYYLYLLRISR